MSDDESSESSDDYLVSPDKIDLDSKFFQATSKPSKIPEPRTSISDDSSDDEFIEEEKDSAALLAEVMKNLEQSNKINAPLLPASSKSPVKKQNLEDEIHDLLMQGEDPADNSSDDDEKEKKDIAAEEPAAPSYTIPKEGVDITLPGTAIAFNQGRKRKKIDLQEELIKRMNRRLRTNQLYIHKVGLLCWLSHGFHLNVQINHPEVLSTAMSLVPQSNCPDGRVDLKYLEKFTKWFKKVIKVEFAKSDVPVTKDLLLERMKKKTVHNHRELVLIYIATLRSIGLNCRLVVSLCPPGMKLQQSQMFQVPGKNDKGEEKERKTKIKINVKGKRGKTLEKGSESSPTKIVPENSSAGDAVAKDTAKKKAVELLSKYSRTVTRKSILEVHKKTGRIEEKDLDVSPKKLGSGRQLRSKTAAIVEKSEEKTSGKTARGKLLKFEAEEKIGKTLPMRKSKIKVEEVVASTSKKTETDESYEDSGSDSDFKSSDEEGSPPKKQRISSKAAKSNAEKAKKAKASKIVESNAGKSKASEAAKSKALKAVDAAAEKSEASESAKSSISKKADANAAKSTASSSRKSSIDRRVLSSDEELEVEKFDTRDSRYLWVEVYVESEESWISVSVPDEKIHCVSEIYRKIPRPVHYVIGWNSSGTLKDITRRYCPHWLTDTRKQRVDEKWWEETLATWKERDTVVSRAEDERLLQKELEQPLPKSMSEVKSHPLYAIARHLLKFEALYPPDCVPLGHLKNGDAIYSRHCVHTLRSRETWLREARIVKPKQDAYKIVKAMPKRDKFTGNIIKDLPLELFGKWQTMPYEPPPVENGIIPRNEYGNIDLFKQCMLPKGAVHIDLPGLNRIARKLGIDCAPAVVGFSFGCRGALPAFEGFVVPEEHEDTLREAWEEEQVIAAERAREKRDKRIWGNWRKLIRGLMIRERLAAKYEFNGDADDDKDAGPEPPSKRKGKDVKKPMKKPKTAK